MTFLHWQNLSSQDQSADYRIAKGPNIGYIQNNKVYIPSQTSLTSSVAEWSYDSNYLAINTDTQSPNTISFWSVSNFSTSRITGLSANSNQISRLVWSPNNTYIATAGGNYQSSGVSGTCVYKKNANNTFSLIASPIDATNGITGVSIDPSSTYFCWVGFANNIAPYEDRGIFIYSRSNDTFTLTNNLNLANNVNYNDCAFCPMDDYLALATSGISLVNTTTWQTVSTGTIPNPNPNNSNQCYAIGWSPDGTYLVGNFVDGDNTRVISVFKRTGSTLTRIANQINTQTNASVATKISWSSDSRWFSIAYTSGVFEMFYRNNDDTFASYPTINESSGGYVDNITFPK